MHPVRATYDSSRRLALCLALLGLALVLTACCRINRGTFSASTRRFSGLPADTAALFQLSDELVAPGARSLQKVDRSLAAMEKAMHMGFPRTYELLWRLARGNAMLAGLVRNKRQRWKYGRQGGLYAREAIRLDGRRVEGYYYLAQCVARMAEAQSKIKYINYFKEKAEIAARLDETFDRAGPLRFLGKLYISAPAWPVSVGSPEKGIEVLKRAVKIAPVAENRLFLGEAYFHDEEFEEAEKLIRQALLDGQAGGLDEEWRRDGERYLRMIQAEDNEQ